MSVVIAPEDPRSDEIVQVLEGHLDLMRSISPPGHVHALDIEALAVANVTFLTARVDGELLGVGAWKRLDSTRAEIKSMHTLAAARGRGVGRRLVEYILDDAASSGITWLGLETGTQPEFEAARQLYASIGFTTCAPFDDYTVNPYSTCMELDLTARRPARRS